MEVRYDPLHTGNLADERHQEIPLEFIPDDAVYRDRPIPHVEMDPVNVGQIEILLEGGV